jgi:hypothetical protein
MKYQISSYEKATLNMASAGQPTVARLPGPNLWTRRPAPPCPSVVQTRSLAIRQSLSLCLSLSASLSLLRARELSLALALACSLSLSRTLSLALSLQCLCQCQVTFSHKSMPHPLTPPHPLLLLPHFFRGCWWWWCVYVVGVSLHAHVTENKKKTVFSTGSSTSP